jgi:hypothetical protein
MSAPTFNICHVVEKYVGNDYHQAMCLVSPNNATGTVTQTDTNTETGGCMYGEGLLMMSA